MRWLNQIPLIAGLVMTLVSLAGIGFTLYAIIESAGRYGLSF